jgi:antitoxin ParD1/3/4
MNVSLTPELEKIVQQKVAGGMYHSASEVIRDALRLLIEHDQIQELRLNALRKDIKKGLDSGDPTPLDMEDVINRGQRRWSSKKAKA